MPPASNGDLRRLLDIMRQLRTPETGCAWDLAQTLESIVPYTIEEAYEVADAVHRGDRFDLRDELGDLLLQVVFYAQIAEEHGDFAFDDVVEAICAKLIRRHPHIFGDARDLTPEQVKAAWDAIKAQERAAKAAERGADANPPAYLDKVPAGLPPLTRALRLQARAAEVGFDWPDIASVIAKVREELDEVEEAMQSDSAAAKREEIGDLLFSIVNVARRAGVDPDGAMSDANAKFIRRFGRVDAGLAQAGKPLGEATLADMDRLWNAAKRDERNKET